VDEFSRELYLNDIAFAVNRIGFEIPYSRAERKLAKKFEGQLFDIAITTWQYWHGMRYQTKVV